MNVRDRRIGKKDVASEICRKIFTVFEIKFMEIHSFNKISHRFGLKCSQMWITNFSTFPDRRQKEENLMKIPLRLHSRYAYVYPMKSPRLIVSINCSVTLITSCLLNRTPSSISSLLLDESDDSLIFSSDPSALALAMTLLPVRNVYLITKVL